MKRLLFILFAALPACMFAQDIPEPQPFTYVNDLAYVLSEPQKTNLNTVMHLIERKTSVQIAVVIIPALVTKSIEEYALQVGRKWHVGNAKNGIVYVISLAERKQRLEIAQNLEGDIPDIIAGQLTASTKPFFRNNDYFGGIVELLKGINRRIDPVAKVQLALAEAEREKKGAEFKSALTVWLLGSLGVALFGIFFYRRYKNKQLRVKEARDHAARNELERVKEEWRQRYEGNNAHEPIIQTPRGSSINPVVSGIASGIIGGSVVSAFSSKRKDDEDRRRDDTPSSSYTSYDYDSSSGSSSSADSSSSSSDWGNWGSGSRDSSSSFDSGFSGGGSSDSW